MQTSEQINELAAALASAQAKFSTIKNDSTAKIQTSKGGEYSYSYATLATTLEKVREHLAANGLAITQFPETAEGSVILTTRLLHKSGQWLETVMSLAANTSDIKVIGSLITYARRYAITAVLGLATDDDDDGDSAGKVQPKSKPAPTEPGTQPGGDGQRPDWCALHDCQMTRHEKDGQTWYSHKTADGIWCNGGKPKGAAPAEQAGHWIDDPSTRAKFWQWVRGEKGLSDEQVYEVLGVQNIHSYAGTAKAACEAIAAKYPKRAAVVVDSTSEEPPL